MCSNRFAMFPRHMLRAGLSRRELLVLLCLLSYRNGDGQAWPSRSKIATETGLSVSHVHEAVKSLAGRGFIRYETQAGVRTVYTFPCLDHTAQNLDMVAPVIAESATTAAPAPKPEPAPAPEQPTGDNLSPVAAPNLKPAPETPAAPVPVVVHETPQSAPQAALQVIDAPQTAAVQGELLPAEIKLRKTRLPKDWQLPRKWGEWAMQEYGFTEDEVRFHAKQFSRHWWSSASPNAYRVSWFLAWQKWMGDECQKKQRYNNRPQQKSKTRMAMERLIAMSGGDFEIPF